MNTNNINPLIDSFVVERKLSGYSFRVQERRMLQFKAFINESCNYECELPKLMEAFHTRNPHESVATGQQQRCLMRQFAVFLNKHGIAVPLPEPVDKYFSYPKRIPYIFTKQELAAIFTQIDCWQTTPFSRGNRTIIDPLIFRIAYGCGMRIMEILTLKCGDVDTGISTIHVRKGKNGRERRIPMAGSLGARCAAYMEAVGLGDGDDKYLFPGRDKDSHASHEAIGQRFKEYLWKAGIARTDKGPVIHDFRHSYCVHRLKAWALSGADISNLLPYMSAFLGHADFRGTEYYLRLTADLYPEIVDKMEKLYGTVIPVWPEAGVCGTGGAKDGTS